MKSFILGIVLLTFQSMAIAKGQSLSIESVKTFTLDSPMTYQWEKEKPQVRQVSLVVVKADTETVRPSQGYEAVIMIEDRVAERVRTLDEARMVMLVPGLISKSSLIWKGPQALPEDIDTTLRQRLFSAAKTEHDSKKSMFTSAVEKIFGLTGRQPIPAAQKISGANDLYDAADRLN